jgi:hypothetical protein
MHAMWRMSEIPAAGAALEEVHPEEGVTLPRASRPAHRSGAEGNDDEVQGRQRALRACEGDR